MLLKRAAETWTLVAADAVALFGLVLTAFPPGCVRLLVLLLRDTFSPVSSKEKGREREPRRRHNSQSRQEDFIPTCVQ